MKLVIKIVTEHAKIKAVQNSITKSNSSSKQPSNNASHIFAKVLYKMVSNQGSLFKDQFIQENGIIVLKNYLKQF